MRWGRCKRCHRVIWDRESLRTGLGSECRKRLGYRYRFLAPVIVNRVIQQAETSTAPTLPHVALTLEFIRQSYNHRDYIYGVWKDLSSDDSRSEKLDKVRQRTVEEIRDEFAGYLVSGGVRSVAAQLSQIGFFNRPLGKEGQSFDEGTAGLFRKFFESSLTTLVGQ